MEWQKEVAEDQDKKESSMVNQGGLVGNYQHGQDTNRGCLDERDHKKIK